MSSPTTRVVSTGIVALAILSACTTATPSVSPSPSSQASNSVQAEGPLEVIDGDSLRDLSGIDYRLIGINAPDRDECLYAAAADRLRELVAGAPVDMSQGSEPVDQFGRHLVYLTTDVPINQTLVAEGLAIAIHSSANLNDDIFRAQETARSAGVGLWNPDSCGDGPLATLSISKLNPNPPGPDEERLEDEYVEVTNDGPVPIDLTGFILRDESTRNRYHFPDGFTLDPNGSVRVHSAGGEFGFGTGSPIWNNGGDTAFLIDSQGRFVDFHRVSES